jgi:OmpA-OmpF porin, OOP family
MKRTTASATLTSVALAALTVSLSAPALADNKGWYGGINLGESRAKIDDARISSGLLTGGFTSARISDDDRDLGYKIFGGYRINRNFAIEGGYFDLGKFGFTANTIPPGTLNGTIKVRGANLDLVGIIPFTEKFSAFGRAGVNYAEAKDAFNGSGFVGVLKHSAEKSEANYKFGGGLQYDFNDAFGMRVEAERYRINDAVGNKGDIDLVSLGLVYRFGTRKAAYISRPTAPEPVVIAPRAVAPEPIAAAPVPSPAALALPMKVTFSADALFDFDRATIRPGGKQSLDKFATDLRGTKFDLITVTGHTDRIGSRAYNAVLSTRRAEAVKTYLVEPAGIAATKIVATGVDESQPVTKPGECKGTSATKALIACLQPDRRVEVVVSGTK